jgi:hypothetical protein
MEPRPQQNDARMAMQLGRLGRHLGIEVDDALAMAEQVDV